MTEPVLPQVEVSPEADFRRLTGVQGFQNAYEIYKKPEFYWDNIKDRWDYGRETFDKVVEKVFLEELKESQKESTKPKLKPEAAPNLSDAVVICSTPDVCLAPDKPTPFQIVAYYNDHERFSNDVRMQGFQATTKNSRITHVYNDEPGVGGGVNSGVNTGYCRPKDGWAKKVNANGYPVLRDGTEFEMNCAGPEGPGNCTGTTVYMTDAPLACIADDGSVEGSTNPAAPITGEEKGWFDKTTDAVGGAWDATERAVGDAIGPAIDGALALNEDYKIVPRAMGARDAVVGVVAGAAAILTAPVPPLAIFFGVIAVDNVQAGLRQTWTGDWTPTLRSQAASGIATTAAEQLGASPEAAAIAGEIAGTAADNMGGAFKPKVGGKIAGKEIEEASKQVAEKEVKKEVKEQAKTKTKAAAGDGVTVSVPKPTAPFYVPQGPLKGKRVGHTFKDHGSHNTDELIKKAKGGNAPQGQWLDDAAAEELIADNLKNLKNGTITIEIPPGLGRSIQPDGSFMEASRAVLVPSKSGVKTAYPIFP